MRYDTTPKKSVHPTTYSPTTPTMSDVPKIKPLPPTPQSNTPCPRAMSRGCTTPPDPPPAQPMIEVTAPLSPTSTQPETNGVSDLNTSARGAGNQLIMTHRTRPSLGKIGFGKFFEGTRSTPDQTNGKSKSTVNDPATMSSRQASESNTPSDASTTTRPRRPSTMQVIPTLATHVESITEFNSRHAQWRREATSVVESGEQLEHQRNVVEEKPEEHVDGHGRTFLEDYQATDEIGPGSFTGTIIKREGSDHGRIS